MLMASSMFWLKSDQIKPVIGLKKHPALLIPTHLLLHVVRSYTTVTLHPTQTPSMSLRASLNPRHNPLMIISTKDVTETGQKCYTHTYPGIVIHTT